MKFLSKESEQRWFEGPHGDFTDGTRQNKKRKEQYEKITIYQLVAETHKAWTVQLSKFDDKCVTYPRSQSHLSLSMDGGNNFIYVTKWLLDHRRVNGQDAITDAERLRRERRIGHRGLRPRPVPGGVITRNLFGGRDVEAEDTVAF